MRRRAAKQSSKSKQAACTIIAKNYLAQARVLSRSFLRLNPEARFFVLLVDDFEGYIDPSIEPFEIISAQELPVENLASLYAKYSILEYCTALKPFLLEHLLDEHDIADLFYLDPDILVTGSLEPLFDELTDHSIILTPHITKRMDDDQNPSEITFLQCGTYNLGFIGISDSPPTREMLTWWQDRCRDHCFGRPSEGLFVDQKWANLMPSLFEGVGIVRDPGYNVAYWNLHERDVRTHPEMTVNGRPLKFFHFSGYDVEVPNVVSKYQSRFKMKDLGPVRELFSHYRDLMFEADYAVTSRWPFEVNRLEGTMTEGDREARRNRSGHQPSSRALGSLFLSGTCRICAGYPILDRLGLRASVAAALRKLRGRSRSGRGPAGGMAGQSPGGASSDNGGLLTKLLRLILNPCPSHPGLSRPTDASRDSFGKVRVPRNGPGKP